jgi:hypothetical protein
MNTEIDRIPPGLWAPIPIPAIKFLVSKGHRPASRVLYAIVLHKGKTKSGIFPSYETIRLYASVGENSIRDCLDTLEKYGFLKITKGRDGKKERNFYEILDKAYQLDFNPKAKSSEVLEPMICNTCWNDVQPIDITTEIQTDWDGRREVRKKHLNCNAIGGYSILIPITESTRANQNWQKSILAASEY